jgi:DDE superfamily endonuclease
LAVARVFALDEARFGLKVSHRRLWCPKGRRPPWTHEQQYQWVWLYATVEPVSGDGFVLVLPDVDGRCFQRFLEDFRKANGAGVGLVLDNSGSQTSGQVTWPDGVQKIPLPPDSPELNPTERWFEALRRVVAHQIFDSLEDLEAALTAARQPYWQCPATLQRLVGYPSAIPRLSLGYPWWCQAMATLTPTPASTR